MSGLPSMSRTAAHACATALALLASSAAVSGAVVGLYISTGALAGILLHVPGNIGPRASWLPAQYVMWNALLQAIVEYTIGAALLYGQNQNIAFLNIENAL
ncbi:hypothetical protein [Red seabream iridovirus]|uniref:ORF107 n=1 Tax=Red sea bream iridovirus TaxID=65424 RepID=A0A218PFP6_RSIV|nr:ORF107 [Red seabream iridovirus]UUU46978.1 hypothetical protein [Red seabream iridovirus]UVC57285.1 hypothetical protein [Red seabream iridovirus]UWH19261.1 hypothetical protein [Infectious spleen and kidney necrosis virus]BAZ95688.1 hypothetical protein [Red seabream iridovirus]